MVGSSGNTAERLPEVTATARRRPELMCGATDAAVANVTGVSPDNTDTTAGPPPLKAICDIFTWAMLSKSTAARCVEVPAPAEA